jgi:hypothetical protein
MDYFVVSAIGLKPKFLDLSSALAQLLEIFSPGSSAAIVHSRSSGPKHLRQIVSKCSQLKTTFVQSSAAQPGSGWEKAPREEQHHGTAAALRRQQHFNQQQRRSNSSRGKCITFFIKFYKCFYIPAKSAQTASKNKLIGAFLNKCFI